MKMIKFPNLLWVALLMGGIFSCNKPSVTNLDATVQIENPYEFVGLAHNEVVSEVFAKGYTDRQDLFELASRIGKDRFGVSVLPDQLGATVSLVEQLKDPEAVVDVLFEQGQLDSWQREKLLQYLDEVRTAKDLNELNAISLDFEKEILCSETSQATQEPVLVFAAVLRHSAAFWDAWDGTTASSSDPTLTEMRGRCKFWDRACIAFFDAAGTVAGLPAGLAGGVLAGATVSTIAYCCQWCGECGGDCPGVDPDDC